MNWTPDNDKIHSMRAPHTIDNSLLYEELGNIVIERADAGDKYCKELFLRAYKKIKEIQK